MSDVSEVKKQPSPIFACINGVKGYSRCGRSPDTREFVFQDADHATDNYDSRRRRIPFNQLSVCHACADAVRRRRKEDEEAAQK